jgi:hypothetical protein
MIAKERVWGIYLELDDRHVAAEAESPGGLDEVQSMCLSEGTSGTSGGSER